MESNGTPSIEDDIIMEIYREEKYFYSDEEWEEIPILFYCDHVNQIQRQFYFTTT